MRHDFKDLIDIFDQCFFNTFNTKLIKGGDEPLYAPANEACEYHQIIFAHGFYASALHEISHWCLAGKARRLLEDFGYWYMPDGRDAEQQKTFEQVEIKPQAIEWAFCVAAGKKFNVSADNLNGATPDTIAFKENVFQQVQQYLHQGFPVRAQDFINALADFYKVSLPLNINQFPINEKFNHPETVTHV
ncbi:elongation factor P hydroxylase [Colwellia hornerae]|nr:elongation factor P hydroxylase [Colwellia hornerae]